MLSGPVLYLRAAGMPHCPVPQLPATHANSTARPFTCRLSSAIAPHVFYWGRNKSNENLMILVIMQLGWGREAVSSLPAWRIRAAERKNGFLFHFVVAQDETISFFTEAQGRRKGEKWD